ncbi:FAD:protein FMN transferase [Jannaschia aquimarina]|uniref:FAD:protein FMN transferase n=1 Tax=Jannaschia aquimarina TaxID=935700 RepID=A0A0D1EAL1_9RHOB|nr:FAD:protein FMN transferase [Jannaschia aquimarina]KIT14739.1 Thiamine biosynthesis lipoprotein ApbE precursor [Jannaschia aquimarina]SNS76559.1 thiamine biosynthesis lipoprotein [Jannaschia aquimarina]
MRRRRFLTLAAGFAAFPAYAAAPVRWDGVALGARVRLELSAPPEIATPALVEALAMVEEVERIFSLYRPDSLVSRLNRDGEVADAPDLFLDLCDRADDLHHLTGGLFDPTVQAGWSALARGDLRDEFGWHGWDRVRRTGGRVRLGRSQQVTFNGIAQGYATDLVTGVLRAHGLEDAFVDLGEQAALGASRRLGVEDPQHGEVAQITLAGGAVATSSPAATPLGRHGHILHPRSPYSGPRWSTVTVEAESATLADGLSTALVLATEPRIRRIRLLPAVRRIVLVDHDGNVRTV